MQLAVLRRKLRGSAKSGAFLWRPLSDARLLTPARRLAISPAQAKRQPETTSAWMQIAMIQCSAYKPSGSTGQKRSRNAPRPHL